MSEKLKEEVFAFLEEMQVKRVSKTTLYFPNGENTITATFKELGDRLLQEKDKYPEMRETYLVQGQKMTGIINLLKSSMKEYNDAHQEIPEATKSDEFNVENFLEGATICIDVNANSGETFLYDFDKRIEYKEYDAETFLKYLERTSDKDDRPIPTPVFGEYNPERITDPFYTKEVAGQEIKVINRYCPPKWVLLGRPANSEVHPLFEKYFKEVFPDEEQRKMLFAWLRNCLIGRNETVLTLNGARGTGKTLLSDTIMKALVGVSNYRKANDGFLKKEFNSIFFKSRLIYIDEFQLKDSGFTKLKNNLNKTISMEKKNQDEKEINNFASVIYSSNNITDVGIAWDERRFNVIEVRKNSLLNAMSGEEIEEMVSLCENDEELCKLGNWIIEKGQHEVYSSSNYAHKGKHFWRIVRANLKNWETDFIEGVAGTLIEDREYYSMKEIKKFFGQSRSRFAPNNVNKIRDFLSNFRDEKGQTPGHIVKHPEKDIRERVFVANKEFFKRWMEDVEADESYLQQLNTNMEDCF